MDRGSLTISIDLELAWGVWDCLTPETLRFAEDAERDICNSLLDLFDRFQVPATWAAVAALLDEKSAAHRPGSRLCWFAPDIIEAIASARVPHEIGSHGGHHLYFDRISAPEAEEDLAFARETHQANRLPFQSLVFPRNRVAHLDVLARAGLRTFRGPDLDRTGGLRSARTRTQRAANFLEMCLPIAPPEVTARTRNGLVDIPGSMLIMGRNGARRFISPLVTRAKLRMGLERARRTGGIFHLWFHPANFYYRRDEQLATLAAFLEHAAAEAARGRIEIRTMGAYAGN